MRASPGLEALCKEPVAAGCWLCHQLVSLFHLECCDECSRHHEQDIRIVAEDRKDIVE